MKVKISLLFAFTEKDIHTRLAKALNFPDYYGKNLDALWDLLQDIQEPWQIEFTNWKGYDKRNKGSLERFKTVFYEAKKNGSKIDISFVE